MAQRGASHLAFGPFVLDESRPWRLLRDDVEVLGAGRELELLQRASSRTPTACSRVTT
jgi:hypothetical protein